MVTYSSICVPEPGDAVSGMLPFVLWHNGLEDVTNDIPKLVVLVLEQDYYASGLRIEGARHFRYRCLEDLLDPRVGDGALLRELIDGTTVLDRVLEACRVVGHLGGRSTEVVLWMKR